MSNHSTNQFNVLLNQTNMQSLLFITLILCASHQALGRQGFGTTEQEWGFVNVREGAHMFWWLHQTSAKVVNYTERPLVIWLQGGPGASSSGFGNFGELGPYDENLNERNTTWLNDVNVLFVDNPVGTGFSYVEKMEQFTTTNRQIAEDFLALMQGFYEALPELRKTPLYIFCESYGGKMTAEIALVLHQAIKDEELDANFVGVGLGDSWISPIDITLSWADYLLSAGAVDQNGRDDILAEAKRAEAAFNAGRFSEATNYWGNTEYAVLEATDGIDFYNILTRIPNYSKSAQRKLQFPAISPRDEVDDKIEVIMNTKVNIALNVTSVWGGQSGIVFGALSEDFMKPVTDIVELLLNTTDLKVAVYNGQLDLIVDTPGTIKWVDELQFEGSNEWSRAERYSLVSHNIVEGYYKKTGNLSFYWVLRAGHMVPLDNPNAMHYILADVTDNFVTKAKQNN